MSERRRRSERGEASLFSLNFFTIKMSSTSGLERLGSFVASILPAALFSSSKSKDEKNGDATAQRGDGASPPPPAPTPSYPQAPAAAPPTTAAFLSGAVDMEDDAALTLMAVDVAMGTRTVAAPRRGVQATPALADAPSVDLGEVFSQIEVAQNAEEGSAAGAPPAPPAAAAALVGLAVSPVSGRASAGTPAVVASVAAPLAPPPLQQPLYAMDYDEEMNMGIEAAAAAAMMDDEAEAKAAEEGHGQGEAAAAAAPAAPADQGPRAALSFETDGDSVEILEVFTSAPAAAAPVQALDAALAELRGAVAAADKALPPRSTGPVTSVQVKVSYRSVMPVPTAPASPSFSSSGPAPPAVTNWGAKTFKCTAASGDGKDLPHTVYVEQVVAHVGTELMQGLAGVPLSIVDAGAVVPHLAVRLYVIHPDPSKDTAKANWVVPLQRAVEYASAEKGGELSSSPSSSSSSSSPWVSLHAAFGEDAAEAKALPTGDVCLVYTLEAMLVPYLAGAGAARVQPLVALASSSPASSATSA